MRPRPALIASALLFGLALGCNGDPPYNTLAQIPPGGAPPIKRAAATAKGKARAPKPPIAKTFRKMEVLGTQLIAE